MINRLSPTIGFISLGCPKNLVDSERILTELRAQGYRIVSNYHHANLVIVNTCGFINHAVEESLVTIREALNQNGKVIVTGCLGTKEDTIRQLHPAVLEVSGPHSYEVVLEQVNKHLPRPAFNPYTSLIPKQGVKLTPKHYAYIKIAEGCNHNCTFCIIPSLRGKLVSRPIGAILDEAKSLVEHGVKELLIIAQDTSAYGQDYNHRIDFWHGTPIKSHITALCQQLGELGIWVRLHYIYPYPYVDQLIPLMAEGKLLPYLDVPLQHASPKLLKSMKRPGTTSRMLERIKNWRKLCPDIALRSTFIVGYPGETDDDFDLLLNFLTEARLDRVGAFTYSEIEGAAANALPNPIPEEIKQRRYHALMTLQQQISADKLRQKVGKTVSVIIDNVTPEKIIGRTVADAPEIDGVVFLRSDHAVEPGMLVDAKITAADEYDLWGNILRTSRKTR